jgi:polyhydroxybutyrate depolymerase
MKMVWFLLWSSSLFTYAGEFNVDLGRGDILVHVPADQSEPMPLLILLHGYTSSGAEVERVLELAPVAEEFGFVYAYPDGTPDLLGNRFWDATDACCNFALPTVDDVGYLMGLIETIQAEVTIDPMRIYIAGHSNGGFMAHRLACERPDMIAAIVSVAGATFADPLDCDPSEPVHVLQIHGTEDETIAFTGGNLFGTSYPGAFDTVQSWVLKNGCSTFETPGDPLDIIDPLMGSETQTGSWVTDCATNGSAHLWTIENGTHVPEVNANFGPLIFQFLLDHAKAESCPADLNDDNQVDTNDLLVQMPSWLTSCSCSADRNEDGMIDLRDAVAMVNDFGICL